VFPKRYGFVVPKVTVLPIFLSCLLHHLSSAILTSRNESARNLVPAFSCICLLVAFPIVLVGFGFEDEGFSL